MLDVKIGHASNYFALLDISNLCRNLLHEISRVPTQVKWLDRVLQWATFFALCFALDNRTRARERSHWLMH